MVVWFLLFVQAPTARSSTQVDEAVASFLAVCESEAPQNPTNDEGVEITDGPS